MHNKVLDGIDLSFEEAILFGGVSGVDLLDLVSLAFKVKKRYSKDLHVCTILNAESGLCWEDCSYCSQSSSHNTGVSVYNLLPFDSVLRRVEKAYEMGVRHFGIVTSGYGYKEMSDEFRTIVSYIIGLKKRFPDMEICASLGVLGEETAKMLVEAGF